ncbi:MAG: hypothetical protein ABGY75_00075, partial [Gemmataceae bacterium]
GMSKYDLETARAAVRRAWRKDQHRGTTIRSDVGRWEERVWSEYAHANGLPHRCVLPAVCDDPDWAIRLATLRQLWAVGRHTYGSVSCDDHWFLHFRDIRGVIATANTADKGICVREGHFDEDDYWSDWSGRTWKVEWADPDMAEKVADAISQLAGRWGLEPFPADWMEADSECC